MKSQGRGLRASGRQVTPEDKRAAFGLRHQGDRHGCFHKELQTTLTRSEQLDVFAQMGGEHFAVQLLVVVQGFQNAFFVGATIGRFA